MVLDEQYDKKILQLGNLCSTMFQSISGANAAESQSDLEKQMDENKQKVDMVKKFVKEINTFMEKVEALVEENRADLMTMFN